MKQTIFLWIGILFFCELVRAEDSSRLWLRYDTGADARIVCEQSSPILDIAVSELKNAWQGGGQVTLQIRPASPWDELGEEGYTLRSSGQNREVTITSAGEKGLLYGAYHLLRLQESGADLYADQEFTEKPAYNLRILNHWDNLDGTIERGYAGHSLWQWDELPGTLSPRYRQYARANASVGINATVLNNVNANPRILSTDYLRKVQALAAVFRPYGIQVFLSINFSTPSELGGLATSDPLDPAVCRWWETKVKEIYDLIPDFGGFLVKANSEGLPGPHDFGRTHVDGANMLAAALKPYNGIVMWRAFVYEPGDDDRAKQAYQEFMPFDGQFRDNVIIQVKNGPVDFQPREPFSPLFGAMQQTPVMPELQITQEYTGFSNHLCFLAPMWKEVLESDTWQQGEGSTVARVTDGSVYPQSLTAIAGVANTGDDVNWCGHPFAQANWYAFGRLAWDHTLTSQQIADEWLAQTFSLYKAGETETDNSRAVLLHAQLTRMMLDSHEAVVDYMMPLGLHHLFAFGHHYGPEPWCDLPGARPDWLPRYYHRADREGLGFDRSATGSNAVAQYHAPLNALYGNMDSCPDELILWFHHMPWDYVLGTGRTLWDELCYWYNRGVEEVRGFQKVWDQAERYVDDKRFRQVQHRLKIQARDAVWWRDACLLYFRTFSRLPIPYELERPVHELKDMMEYRIDITNFECPPYGFTK
ncbi:MAG: alpha-glucuronidase [Bacteroides sp.]|nr:alpha-glucuronidase [Bacteroides sp.]